MFTFGSNNYCCFNVSVGTTPSPLGTNAQCDFESRSICGFTQDKSGDQFDWMRDNQGTSSSGTGPRTDHTLGTAAGTVWLAKLLTFHTIQNTMLHSDKHNYGPINPFQTKVLNELKFKINKRLLKWELLLLIG